jgi:hypothetical protein
MKTSVGAFIDPVTGQEVVTKTYGDDNYASVGAELAIVQIERSAKFYDADDQFASVVDPGVFQGLAAMTIEGWFTLDRIDSGYYGFCGQGQFEDDVAFSLKANNTGTLEVVFSTNGGIASQSISFSHGAAVGEWTHVAVTWDGAAGTTNAYINGVLVSGPTNLVAGTIFDSSSDFHIGRYDETDFDYEHHGLLSELRIWNTERTARQILDSMYGVARGNEVGLITVHHLNNNFRDNGPNAVHLTPDANAPTFVRELPFNNHTLALAKSAAQNTQSYNFVGAGDDYLFRTDPGIYGGHAALSVECWLKPTSTLVNSRGLISHDNVFWVYATSSTQIVVAFSTNGTMVTHTITPGWTLNEWTHFACTWDGINGEIKAYVDGVLTGGTTVGQQGKSYTTNTALTLGIYDGILEGWDGNISEVRIWSTVRTVNQIVDSMFGTMTGNEHGLLSLYHLNGTYNDSGPFVQVLTAGNAPVLSDNVPYGSYAQKLLHASGAIDGSAAAAPTAGQVATAIDADTFDWQTTVQLDAVQEFTASQRSHVVALTDLAVTLIDAAAGNVFELTATGGIGATRQLDNPTNLAKGMTWIVIYNQDGTGSRALTFDTFYDFGTEGAPDLSSDAANLTTIISCVALSTTQIACSSLLGFV